MIWKASCVLTTLLLIPALVVSQDSDVAIGAEQTPEVVSNDIEGVNEDLELQSFSWSDCTDEKTRAVVVHSVSVAPDPVLVPGNVTVGYTFTTLRNLTGPAPFSMRIQKKVSWFWVDIPCENNQGSCDYADFCTKWPIPSPCPEAYPENKIPCTCPFLKGDYVLPPSYVGTIKGSGPSWLSNGDYKLKSWISDPEGNQLLCLMLNLSLKSAKR